MSATEIRDCPGPDPAPRPPGFAVPEGACDCHAHVFAAARYPYQATRAYTPPNNGVERLLATHAALGLTRGVVVQASVHGTDNRAVLDAARAHPDRLRCIVAVDATATEAELAAMHAAGARGLRVNLVDRGGNPFASLAEVARLGAMLRPLGWHVELLVHVQQQPAELRSLAEALGVPVSVGHIGYTKPPHTVDHPGYREFLAMLRDGLFWVKLTGLYRISARTAPPYDDATPFARAVLAAAPDRVVWGSDWPHVHHYGAMPNDGALLDALADWAPDAALRRRVLVDNPARLYGFPAAG